MLSSQRTAWFKGHLRKVGTTAGTKWERDKHWEAPRRKFQTVHRLSINN